MNLKAFLFDEDRGVSPVIGVILMVAITVILAAVIATFVMNMGPSENTMPNANFGWDEDSSGNPILVHEGGEAVPHDQVPSSSSTLGAGSLDKTSGDEWTASDTVVGSIGTGNSGATITLVWENPDSGETQVLYEGEVP